MVKHASYQPDIGDKLFTRGTFEFSDIAEWVTRGKGEKNTIATHVGTFLDDYWVIEAQHNGVIKNSWITRKRNILDRGGHYCVMKRMKEIPPMDRYRYYKELCDMIGSPYGWFELPLQLLDGLLEKMTKREVIFFRKLGEIMPGSIICSKAAAKPEVKINALPKRSIYWDPDRLYDFLLYSNDWVIAEHSDNWMNEFIGD